MVHYVFWILDAISREDRRDQTEVITADRYLRKAAQAVGAKTINPVKWWRRYLPRIKGLKSDYSNEQKPTN